MNTILRKGTFMTIANDMHRGMAIKHKGDVYVVREYTHQKPGKGGAFLQVNMKSIKTGKVITERFRSNEEIEVAFIQTKVMQYLYEDPTGLVFMDNTDYEQITIPKDLVGERSKYLVDNMEARISFYEGEAIDIVLPSQITVEITYAPPGERGDTATNALKEAKTDLGFDIQVPLFIKVGDKVRISTETGEYLGKAN